MAEQRAGQVEEPRERLLEHGSSVLSEAELVSVVLGCSGRRESRTMAREMLEECGGLAGLAESSMDLPTKPGVGPAAKARLLASLEIGRRLAGAEMPDRYCLDRPESVARFLALRFVVAGQEVMGALYLNVRNRLLHAHEVFRGTLDRASVEPRPLLKAGLMRNAASMILFHTHPSGDPAPSIEDLAFTRRLAAACDVVGLRFLDHLILGHGGRWLSLRQNGGW